MIAPYKDCMHRPGWAMAFAHEVPFAPNPLYKRRWAILKEWRRATICGLFTPIGYHKLPDFEAAGRGDGGI